MRSRAVRLSCVVVAWIALVATAFLVVRAEQQLSARRAERATFDTRARDVIAALADIRSGQQAYVAAGQGVAFWSPKVEQTADALLASIATLRASTTSPAARDAADETTTALARFDEIDARAREYLRGGQVLMASDIIFSEGSEIATTAAQLVDTARQAERQALEELERTVRRREGIAVAVAAGATAIMALLLGLNGPSRRAEDEAAAAVVPASRMDPAPAPPTRAAAPALRTAAQLCTDFACMQDVNDLQLLLHRASDVMDAAGLIVWLGSPHGDDLQPVLTHGYSDETRARLPNVPRSASNAAAAAYRSGDVQIVLSRPGGSKGAIVAPIRGTHGCIGALSVEIRGGGEASDTVQSLAAIVAAQLAGVLLMPPGEAEPANARAAASS
jgi:hypothetical protein